MTQSYTIAYRHRAVRVWLLIVAALVLPAIPVSALYVIAAAMILLLLAASGWLVKRKLGSLQLTTPQSGVFFFLGAGFMLIETKVITELGLECAKALRDMGLDTHVVEFAPRLMAVQVDEGGGADGGAKPFAPAPGSIRAGAHPGARHLRHRIAGHRFIRIFGSKPGFGNNGNFAIG